MKVKATFYENNGVYFLSICHLKERYRYYTEIEGIWYCREEQKRIVLNCYDTDKNFTGDYIGQIIIDCPFEFKDYTYWKTGRDKEEEMYAFTLTKNKSKEISSVEINLENNNER